MSDNFSHMYSYHVVGVLRKKSLISIVVNFAPAVEMMLLMRSFMVIRLAVGFWHCLDSGLCPCLPLILSNPVCHFFSGRMRQVISP